MQMFTKIKHSTKGIVEIHWLTIVEDAAESIKSEMESDDEPRKEFRKALQAFRGYVQTICELPTSWKETLDIISISLKPDEEGEGRGLTVTAVRHLGNGLTLLLNTPFLTEYGFGEGLPKWPDGVADLVHRACEEAKSYREGDRAQQVLRAS